ncbi:MAG: putative T7SS-secreted protein, partial [Frankia sp.]
MARPLDWYLLDLDGDPAPGDPFAIRDLARRFLALAQDADRASTGVRGSAHGDAVTSWVGRSGDAFREEIGALPGQLDKVAASYGRAGHALTTYASALIEAQAQSERALTAGRLAAHRLAGARAELTTATGVLRSAPAVAAGPSSSLISGPGLVGDGIALPDRAAVAAATRNHAAAQARLAHARTLTDAVGDELDAARRLAQAARDLREQAEDSAVHALRDASHAGIRNQGWFHHLTTSLAGSWHTTVEVCKIAGLVLAVASLVLTGPVIGTLLTITAVVMLADTLRAYREGRAGPFQVALAIAAVLPGGRLAHGAQVAARLAADARVLREAPEAGTIISRDLVGMPWEREPGEWHRLLSERAQIIARREKRMVRRVAAAVRPHYDDLRGRWPMMPEEERNAAIRQILQ